MMKKRTKAFLVCIAFILTIGLGLYSLLLAFTEDLYVEEGTYTYYLLIPSLIKDIPRPQVIGTPEYYSSCGDGPKPMTTGISFHSRASRTEIYNRIDEYLRRVGYVPDVVQHRVGAFVYYKGENGFEFTIKADKGDTYHVIAQEHYF
jgi:hypothetical protein